MYKIFVFSMRSSWNVTYFLSTLSKGRKLANNTERFCDFKNLENLRTHFASFWALEKSINIIWDDQIFCQADCPGILKFF